jgi:TPR repeat protein
MDAALQGHAVAQNKLGVYFLKQGNQASDEKAAQLLTAASKSHAASRYNLGLLYLHGRGVEQNTEKAKALFESIVQTLPQEQAFVDHIGLESTKLHTQAFLHLGLLLLNTEGEQHLPRAIDYISAAVVGEDRCAQRILGFLTLLGLGVEQSRNEGYLLLRKAAAQNDSLAHLGVALLNSNVDLSVILKENNLLTIISQASSQAVFL